MLQKQVYLLQTPN